MSLSKVEALEGFPDIFVFYDGDDIPVGVAVPEEMIRPGEKVDLPDHALVILPFSVMKRLVANWVRKKFHHQIDHTDDDTFLIEGPQASDF